MSGPRRGRGWRATRWWAGNRVDALLNILLDEWEAMRVQGGYVPAVGSQEASLVSGA